MPVAKKKKNVSGIMISIAWTIAVLVCVKSIFTDFGGDNAYQVAMSYRHISGDRMFLQMWEPHQMSIFLNDLFMLIYRLFVPSLTGVVLYLQICGTLVFGLAALLIFRTIREYTGNFTAHLICIFFMVFRAKQTPLAEFANMEILFSALAFCILIRVFGEKMRSVPGMILTAFFIFLQILSYPTCILSVFAVIILICTRKSSGGEKLKRCLVFLGSLFVMGICYGGYFLVRIGPSRFIGILRNIFMSDTHSAMRFGGYWTGFLIALAGLLLSTVLGLAVHFGLGRLIKRIGGVSLPVTIAACSFAVEVVLLIFQRRTGIDWTCSFFVIPLLMIVTGLLVYRKMTDQEKMIFFTGVGLSAASFFATLLLTDLGMITIVAYLVLGGAVSFIPLRILCRDHKVLGIMILAIVLFHRGAVIWGYGNTNGRVILTYEAQNIIRSGPGVGIVCDHVTKNQAAMNERDFALYTDKNDKIFIIGEALMDPLDFLRTDAEISNYSTIDTPFYNEALERYLELNPEKMPTVIAVSCWYGQMLVPEDSYIMQWVNENYTEAGDGDYYRFYRISK